MHSISILSDSLLDFAAAGKKHVKKYKKHFKRKGSNGGNKTIQKSSIRQELLSRNKIARSTQVGVNVSLNLSTDPSTNFTGNSVAAQAQQQNTFIG